jgi:integrase/recombinase XerD
LGFTHPQFEALLTAARPSPDPCDFALVTMLGLRIFEATSTDIADLGEEHGHRVLRVCGKGTKIVLVPVPPAVSRAIDRAVADRTRGPVLLNSRGARMDRHAAARRLRRHMRDGGRDRQFSLVVRILGTPNADSARLTHVHRAPAAMCRSPRDPWHLRSPVR